LIPKNNLDDRIFDDIVEEAIRLIPRYCPEWTNHNPTDPGITLVELFAWMTEMTLYRLNQVPEKTYLSLLELMGLSLIPPQPARAVIRFYPIEGYKKSILIPGATQVAASGDSAFIFETERDLSISSNNLVSCINRSGEAWKDYCTNQVLSPFMLFETAENVEHVLYISSPVFAYLANEHHIQISFTAASEISSVQDEIVNFLYWEYWDGRDWVHIVPQPVIGKKRKKDNVVYFSGPLEIEPCTVNGYEGYFLRAVLAEVPENRKTLTIKDITLETHFGGSGFLPDLCLANAGIQYQPVDLNSTFRIFSENPDYNEIFYIAADNVFCQPGNKVTLVFTFSEIYVPGNENDNAQFAYEYWDGSAWQKLGQSPRSSEGNSPFAFKDSTFAFKQSGEVQFTVPRNLLKAAVNGEEHYWIRIRLSTKDFSLGGEYNKTEKGGWMWRFSAKVHSPLFSKIRITYNAGLQKPDILLSDSNFTWQNLGELFQKAPEDAETELPLFAISQDTIPALYLGFSSLFPQGNASLFVKINDERSPKPGKQLFSFFDRDVFSSPQGKRLVELAWEYWNGTSWVELSVNDYTDMFHESGFVEFATPADMAPKDEFSKKLYWLRVRFVSGSFETQPMILSIFTNAVYARNQTTHRNETIGSGTGAPAQLFTPAHGPLLPGIELFVDEGSIPPTNEVELLASEGVKEPYIQDGESVWVRYKEVDNFYTSTSLSRHFVVDYQEQKIHFGDGQKGINPPRRKFNIRLASYSTGGGSAGNVAAGTLRILTQSIPFVAGCDNPFPAEGGSDMESVDNLKARAAGVFKSLQRAVTGEDFQWLSHEASASVGRAWCLKDTNRQGEICVIVIPVLPAGESLAYRLIPSRELIRRVSVYLSERKLVGTRIRVQGPRYRGFSIVLTLVFRSDILDVERLKKAIETAMRSFFHALRGGEGGGWEFGKTVTGGAVLKQLEKIEGILSVDDTQLFDIDAGVAVNELMLKEDELPYLDEVRIENRRGLS
jgi:hypothetical protein